MKKIIIMLIFMSCSTSWAQDKNLKVIKDYHSDILDSISDYFKDEFYSSKEETFERAQKFNARVGKGPGDICYQMRYDRKNLTYKLPNGTLMNIARKTYYDGDTLHRDCLVNEKFSCMRLYYVGDNFYCTDFEAKDSVRILDMNLNERIPDKLHNCGLKPIVQKNKNKVLVSIGNYENGQKGLSLGKGHLPKINLSRTLNHGKCEIKIENKLQNEKEEKIFNQSKTHIIGIAKVGKYKCSVTGGDLDLNGDVMCDSITLSGEYVKCHHGQEITKLRFLKTCFENSGETVLTEKDNAIQNSSRKPEIIIHSPSDEDKIKIKKDKEK